MDETLAAMILSGGRVAVSGAKAARVNVEIRGGRVVGLGAGGGGRGGTRSLALAVQGQGYGNKAGGRKGGGDDRGVDISGCLVLPGLINAHDHLAFNLFPLLGRPPYRNATEWARDVYRPEEAPVLEHRKVPRDVRLAWGGLKNLISGVTTVGHHDLDRFPRGFPVKVARAGWAHSLGFTSDVVKRFERTPEGCPFVMHLGEGTDAESAAEVFLADRMGVLDVIVHGVGLNVKGWALLKKRGASVVTCPVSNLFTLGRTLRRPAFSTGVPIALGTDSAITATGDLLDALRAAREIWKLSAARVYRMVTSEGARVLRLTDGEGEIRVGGVADLIVVRDTGGAPAQVLMGTRRVEMVVVGGRVRMVSERFARFAGKGFQRISVEGRGRVWVDADVKSLYEEAVTRLGASFKLAGRWVRIKWKR